MQQKIESITKQMNVIYEQYEKYLKEIDDNNLSKRRKIYLEYNINERLSRCLDELEVCQRMLTNSLQN